MVEIGNVNEELVLNCSGSLKIRRGNDLIEFFDSLGNPNIKLKNVVKDGQPNYNSVDGIYFDGINTYIKSGNTIKTISLSLGGNASLPEGTILLYKGVTNPTGWYFYPESTGIDGLIYISNKQYTGKSSIELYERGSITKSATVGDTYNLPFSEIAARYATTLADYGDISGELYFEVTGANGYNNYASLSDDDTKLTFSRFGYTKVIAKVDANSSHTAASYEYILQINKKTYNLLFLNPPQISITSNTWVHLLDYIDKPTLGNNDLLNSILFYLNGQQVTEYMLFTTVGYNSIQAILPSTNLYEEARSGYLTVMVSDSGTTDYNGSVQSFDIFGNNQTPGTIRYMKTLTNTKPLNKSEFTTSVPSALDAGTYYIWYTINNGDIDGPVVRTISPKIVSNPTIILSLDSYTYDGTAKTPTVIVKDGNHVILASEYTVGYSNNTNIGTATVTVTDVTGGNYVVNGSTTFTISSAPKASITAAPTAKTLIYNETAQDLINAGTASNGTVYYKVTTSNTKPSDTSGFSSSIPTGTDAGTYYVWYYAKGDTGYDDGDISSSAVTVTITQEEETIETSASITNDYITEYQSGGNSVDNDNVKVEIVNNSSDTLMSSVVFNNLNSEDTWIYNDNGDVTLSLTNNINSGTNAEYNGGTLNNLDGKTPVPSSYPGFLDGNVHITRDLLDGQGYNMRFSGFADNVVLPTYSKGKCYTLTVTDNGITVSVGDNIQSGSYVTSDSKIKVKIKNNTESNLTLTGAIKFKNGNTDIVSTTFNNSSVTINSGSSSTEYEIDFGNNAVTNTPSLTSIELTTSSNETISIALTSATFNMGALYTINYGEVSTDALFDTLLSDFNTVLYGSNSTKLTEESPDTVAYLDAMYKLADAEWKKNYSDSLFNADLYPEAVEYRNTSDTNGDTDTQKAMQGWLMAMCLSELCLSSGSSTNNLTKLYEKAMTYGNSDLYTALSINSSGSIVAGSNYGYKKDAMIARFVAGAIYASNHDSLIGEINDARQELGGVLINGDDFSALECNKTSYIGYMPELTQILPVTPGPYANQAGYTPPVDKPIGNIFYGLNSNTNDNDLRDYNYKMDIAINNYVKQNYNLWGNDETDSVSKLKKESEQEKQDDIRQIVFEAGSIGICSKLVFFGKKKFKYLKTIDTTSFNNAWKHEFTLADNSSETCGNNEYLYKGPFSDWYSDLFTNSPAINAVHSSNYLNGDDTDELTYLLDMLDIFDERCFIYYENFGRRRPLGSETGGPIYSNYNHNSANGLQISNVMLYLADSRTDPGWNYTVVSGWDDFPGDSPKSYPSGHSAQSWGIAMLLSLIKPSMLKTYMKNAWRFGVERVIGRAHWNSDVLYGRLAALTVLPIINAMNGSSALTNFMTNYNSLRTTAGNSTITKTGNGVTPSEFGFNITIDNSNMSEAISLNGEFILYLENPDSEGLDHGWQGAYNGSNTLVFSNSPVTINAGESQTFSVISSYYIADEDKDGVDEVHLTTISKGLDMQNGVPRNMCDGHTLRVSTYLLDSLSGVWDYGHRNNVKIYIAGAHNGDTVIIKDLSSNVTISNGATLTFEVISTNGGGNGSNPPQSGDINDIIS